MTTTTHIDTDQQAALVAGLRAAADFIEQINLGMWQTARISRHVQPDEFKQVSEALGVETTRNYGFAHVTRWFGPVELDVQASDGAIREAENLDAFWHAYHGLSSDLSRTEMADMARRYGLTDEQVQAVLGEAADGPVAA